jgi:conjugal transfer mating pair stabilization protein TraG
VLSSSRSLDRAESQSERFGTLGAYNGIAAGAALVRPEHQALNEQLDRAIAHYGLDGDRDAAAQRLLVGGVTADRDQARAIAGMGLLLGHTDGQRARGMSPEERAGAKTIGMDILSKEFNVAAPAGIAPNRNADLPGSVPGFGGTRIQVESAGLRDVRTDAAGVPGQVSEHRDTARHTWNPGDVDQFAQAARQELTASTDRARTAVRSEKQARIGEIIEQHATLPRTAAQVAEHEAGGLLTQAAETVALAGAGVGGVASQVAAGAAAFGRSLKDGHGLAAAVQAGRAAAGGEAGWRGARAAMVDARMNQISSYGLSPAQEHLYREATESVFAGAPSATQQAAHQAVVAEAGSPRRGEQIADLIERSASSKDDTDLRLIGAYNEQGQGSGGPDEKKNDGARLGTGSERRHGGAVTAPGPLKSHFRDLERENGLPAGLLTAIASVESHFNPHAVSPAGAQGMFQIMPRTASELGVVNPFDAREAAAGAARHLARDYRTFGNWNHAVLAYNAGPHRIEEYLAGRGKPLKQETLDYLPKVLDAFRHVDRSA